MYETQLCVINKKQYGGLKLLSMSWNIVTVIYKESKSIFHYRSSTVTIDFSWDIEVLHPYICVFPPLADIRQVHTNVMKSDTDSSLSHDWKNPWIIQSCCFFLISSVTALFFTQPTWAESSDFILEQNTLTLKLDETYWNFISFHLFHQHFSLIKLLICVLTCFQGSMWAWSIKSSCRAVLADIILLIMLQYLT